MTADTQSIQFIPLSKLIPSPRNVRRRDRKADIDSLAASIAARGLLQNLCVVPAAEGKFEVDAGGRRLAALKKLVRDKAIPKDFSVPCHVVALNEGREVSLIENVQRVAMDAMDEVDAYAALVADGATPDEVARRFGVERRHVDQRLALSGLSPKIKAAWKRGDITLDAAKAFCLVDDHAQQEAVFRSLGRPVTHAASVRARLMDGRMRASDRLAVFVGLHAYEAAGGKIVRDLFDTEAVFIEDPALLTKLAEDRLNVARAPWLSDGWSWADVQLGSGRADGLASTRFHPDWREPTPEEQAELDRLMTQIEKLDTELEAASLEDDPRWSTRDDLEAAYETIRQAARCWSAEVKKVSGVVLSVDHAGDICASEGLVRSADQKRAEALLKQRREGERDEAADDGDGHDRPAPVARVSVLPKGVNRDVTLARTRAIRQVLAHDPDVALALCVAAMAQRSLRNIDMTGVSIAIHARQVDDLVGIDEARAELESRLPESELDILDWALDLSRERLLAVLAVLVAGAVDLAHEDSSAVDLRRQAIADRLSQQLDINMTAYWKPDLDFWLRLPKSALLAAVSDAPEVAERSDRARAELVKAHAKLRKEDLAAKVAALYQATGYLPELLVTPVVAGSLAITAEGVTAMAVQQVAAE